MKLESLASLCFQLAQAPATEMPAMPKADFTYCGPPPTLADHFGQLQPGISWLLLALLLGWLIHTLWRPRDAQSPQRWRLLCLGFLAVNVGLIGQLILPFAISENPSFSTSLIALIAVCLGLSLISLLASFRRATP